MVKPQVLQIGSQTPADGVDQGWGQHCLCPSRPLPRDLAHLTALWASYTDKPLCARPAQLLPSKPDGSLNGVLSSLLSFLLQKHMLKTKFPTFCHPAAPTESTSSHSRLLQPSRFSGRRFGTSHGAPLPTPTSAPPANPVCLCLRHTSGIQAYLNPLCWPPGQTSGLAPLLNSYLCSQNLKPVLNTTFKPSS